MSPKISMDSSEVMEEFEGDWVIGAGSSASGELGGVGVLFRVRVVLAWEVCVYLCIAPEEWEEGIVEVVGVVYYLDNYF